MAVYECTKCFDYYDQDEIECELNPRNGKLVCGGCYLEHEMDRYETKTITITFDQWLKEQEEYASNFDNCDGECVDECVECQYYKSRGMC